VGIGVLLNRFSTCYVRQACAALGVLFIVFASPAGLAGDDHGHERARQALEAGEVLPLRSILERVERDYPGQVVDVELEREHKDQQERWVYEVKVLRTGGALIKLKVDARDGTIIGRKFKGSQDGPQKNRGSGEGH
jgi:hypothetical protein